MDGRVEVALLNMAQAATLLLVPLNLELAQRHRYEDALRAIDGARDAVASLAGVSEEDD